MSCLIIDIIERMLSYKCRSNLRKGVGAQRHKPVPTPERGSDWMPIRGPNSMPFDRNRFRNWLRQAKSGDGWLAAIRRSGPLSMHGSWPPGLVSLETPRCVEPHHTSQHADSRRSDYAGWYDLRSHYFVRRTCQLLEGRRCAMPKRAGCGSSEYSRI